MEERRRRVSIVVFISLIISFVAIYTGLQNSPKDELVKPRVIGINSSNPNIDNLASVGLTKLSIKGRAPKTGYTRAQFSDGWETVGNCDVRNIILARDMSEVKFRSDTDCTVLGGSLEDPYTGKTIQFLRGIQTSDAVQIDHVVALSDAWQKGAQTLSPSQRLVFANDGLNLLAVDGPTNQQKGDGDAATWLPPNKSYRCRFVAR